MTPAQAKEFFLTKFSNVLVTEEDMPLRKVFVPPMKIHFREDAKSFAIHTICLIPLAFQEAIKAELNSKVAQGVISHHYCR